MAGASQMMTWSSTTAAKNINHSISSRFGRWVVWTASIAIVYHLLLLAALMFRFGDIPNYIKFYNWPENIGTIIKSTPSVSDMIPIIIDEWLFEIGFMNYDYGHGISEWSLSLQPPMLVIVLLFSAFITTNIILLMGMRNSCSSATLHSAGAVTGLGSFLVAITSATMSWVVCCATPTWVVGLAMLGLGVSTSLWLEPLGVLIASSGFLLLIVTTLSIAGIDRAAPAEKNKKSSQPGGAQNIPRKLHLTAEII